MASLSRVPFRPFSSSCILFIAVFPALITVFIGWMMLVLFAWLLRLHFHELLLVSFHHTVFYFVAVCLALVTIIWTRMMPVLLFLYLIQNSCLIILALVTDFFWTMLVAKIHFLTILPRLPVGNVVTLVASIWF